MRFKLFALLAAILSAGCQKHPIMGVASTPQSGVVPLMGQSNPYYMGLKDSELIRTSIPNTTEVINCAVGGTDMSRWTPNGDLYLACMERIGNRHVNGIIFWQGETDTAWGGSAIGNWAARFRSMCGDLQHRFGAPIVFAQITDTKTLGRDDMRAIQAGMVIPGVVMVGTDGITQVGDHTDDEGYKEMAGRFLVALHQ